MHSPNGEPIRVEPGVSAETTLALLQQVTTIINELPENASGYARYVADFTADLEGQHNRFILLQTPIDQSSDGSIAQIQTAPADLDHRHDVIYHFYPTEEGGIHLERQLPVATTVFAERYDADHPKPDSADSERIVLRYRHFQAACEGFVAETRQTERDLGLYEVSETRAQELLLALREGRRALTDGQERERARAVEVAKHLPRRILRWLVDDYGDVFEPFNTGSDPA